MNVTGPALDRIQYERVDQLDNGTRLVTRFTQSLCNGLAVLDDLQFQLFGSFLEQKARVYVPFENSLDLRPRRDFDGKRFSKRELEIIEIQVLRRI